MKLKHLWVMRHGLAESQFDSDFNRQLSELGKQQASDVALQIKTEKASQPQTMLVSPFCRTQMTAEIVHRILELETPFITEELLVHFADHRLLADFLIASDYENLIIVSHMPIVAHLCGYLVADPDSVFAFETAQVIKINFAQNVGNNDLSVNMVGKIEACYLPQC